jgi:hypothetical protein
MGWVPIAERASYVLREGFGVFGRCLGRFGIDQFLFMLPVFCLVYRLVLGLSPAV